jgi:hypothetical protein
MRDAIASRITSLPEQLRQSLTWDRAKELAAALDELLSIVDLEFDVPQQGPSSRGVNTPVLRQPVESPGSSAPTPSSELSKEAPLD